MNEKKIHEYLDGNGNKYVLTSEGKNKWIEYIPMKPDLSSSGYYDGGSHVIKEISDVQFNKILSIMNEAMKNEKSHVRNRMKKSGMIIIHEISETRSCILDPASKEIHEIEEILQEIINN